MKFYLIALALIVAVTGCSVLSTVAEDQNQLAVQYATLKVLERNDVESERVLSLVEQAKAYAENGATVSVASLAVEARDRLAASGLSPADKMLIEAILIRAEERLSAKIGDGLLDAEQRVQLLTVLSWIEGAARAYHVPS